MEVIATARGYHKQIREVGERFEMPDGSTGSWFEPVAPEAEAKPRKKRNQPEESKNEFGNHDL